MSEESNQEIFFRVLGNGIFVLTNEKKNFKDNLEELNDFLTGYLINLPTESKKIKSEISTISKTINTNFTTAIGLLKNINNRTSRLFSNIFINIDIP
ncbi:TPA: hypothetical protein JIF26_002189, partial [Acinetobacter baumannii]|nr:hypothetical protein [Acinetobacter baumannii]